MKAAALMLLAIAMPVAAAPLPKDVARLASRIEGCLHFAGEFNGDRSERDREVTRAMEALRCDRVRADADTLRRRYRHDRRIADALAGADDL